MIQTPTHPSSEDAIQNLRINQRYLNVSVQGNGPGFIWSHGQMWNMAVEDAGWFDWSRMEPYAQLIRYDAVGHGGSQPGAGPDDYAWPQLAKDMLELSDEMQLDRHFLGGQSMGGAAAIHAAMMDPGRVAGLIVANPPVAWEQRTRQESLFQRMAVLTQTMGVKGLIDSLRPFMAAGWWIKDFPAMERAFFQAAEAIPQEVMIHILRGAARSNLPTLEELKTLQAPVLILAWPNDRTHPMASAETLAATFPNAKLIIAHHKQDLLSWPQHIRHFIQTHGESLI